MSSSVCIDINEDYVYFKKISDYFNKHNYKYVKTYDGLFEMRQRVDADRVYWILPAGNNPASGVKITDIQKIVQDVAEYYGDTVLPINSLQPDGIHPSWAGYKDLAARAK